MPAPDLESMAQRYVTVHLAESVFKSIAGLLEDWIVGLTRLWLTAYPVQLDTAYHDATDRSRAQRRDEIQVPLSDVLEHNRGRPGPDYLEKAGASARYAVGDIVQIDEPYLMQCLALMREVIEAMADAAIRRSSGSQSG